MPHSDGNDPWRDVMATALTGVADAPGALLFLEARRDLAAEWLDGELVSWQETAAGGVSMRSCFERGRTGFLADPRPDEVAELVARTVRDAGRGGASATRRAGTDARSGPHVEPPEPIDLSGLTAPEGSRIRARWISWEQEARIARPGDAVRRDCRRAARLRLDVRCASNGRAGSATTELAFTGRDGSDRGGAIERALRRARDRAVQRADSRPAPAGEREVVLGPGVGGVLVHELVGHALEADLLRGGDSWLVQFEEPRSNLTIIDDPRRGRAAWRIDDEGQPSAAMALWRDGRAVGILRDLRSASIRGLPPTGHGRRASFREPVRPRMGCTFVAAGELDPADVLGEPTDGVYVRRMESAGTEPRNGTAFFRVTDADRIVEGQLAEPLDPFLLQVEGPSVIRRTRRVATDLAFDTCIGSCHKDGQAIAVSVGAPTICIGLATVLF